MRARSIALGMGLLCALAVPGLALAININGMYKVTVVQSSTTDPPDNCTWVGQATLAQTGSTFTGSMFLNLVKGVCDDLTLEGPVNGTITGNVISFGLFGTTNFTGTVSDDGNSMSGSFDTGDPDSTGAWAASRGAPVPVASHWGLAGLVLVFGWVGLRSLRRV